MAKTVVGLYDNLGEARAVIEDLVNSGFRREDVSLVAHAGAKDYERYFDNDGRYRSDVDYAEGDLTAGEGAAAGAGIGATIGGIGGLLMGLGLLAIPGVGPAVAAGPLASTLVGAGIGGVAGGLMGALVNAGVPEDDAERYSEGVRRGGSLVVVHASDEMTDDAANIMNRHGAIDIEERAERWRESGWTGFDNKAEPYNADQIRKERELYGTSRAATTRTANTGRTETRNAGDKETFDVVQEDLKVGKRETQRGGVRVHSHTTERPVEENVRLRDEKVNVERHKTDRPVRDGDAAFQEKSIEMTERHEEPVVSKEARVVEEVEVSKQARERTETVRDTVRRTDVEIERVGGDVDDRDYSGYNSTFREHHEGTPIRQEYSFDEAEPAYRYGYVLARDERYADRDWDEIEPEARREWEARNRGTWETFRDSIRHSWMEARNER